MPATYNQISPQVLASSLTLAAELFAQWQAGNVVVLDKSGAAVEMEKWVQNPKTLSADAAQAPCTFKFRDGKWTVGFANGVTLFKQSVGFKYTHLLLHGKPFCVSQIIGVVNSPGTGADVEKPHEHNFEEGGRLEGLAIHRESKDPLMTNDALKFIRKELLKLKQEREMFRADGDRENAEVVEEKIERLEQHLKKTNFKGFNRASSNQYKRDLDSVRLAINRAIKSIGTVNPTLAWHLTCSIKFGAQCVYRPEKKVIWDL